MTDIVYRYQGKVYFNLTNRCPCRCTFCIRSNGPAVGEAENLWFQKEPSMEEIRQAIDDFDFQDCKEAVFCGYGEPVAALNKLLFTSRYVRKKYDLSLRLNTNGLGDLIWGRSVAKEVCRAVDSVSVSLNMPDAASYDQVVRSIYGEQAFPAMLRFACSCKKYLDDVRFTVVDCIGEEKVERSRILAESLGIPLRVRAYEGKKED
ncbi:MAG: TIGR04100 family radical SAM protein [Eubacteriales bacterium]|nr:TIGR04100 family radical SAM protein [Eubacteriales bacterium]